MSEFFTPAPKSASVPPPPPANEGAVSMDQIQAMIDARVQQVQSAYDEKIAALEKRYAEQLKAARGAPAVNTMVPTHAGGPGHEITEVWSQWHQQLANEGKLTEEHLRHVRGQDPIEVGVPE